MHVRRPSTWRAALVMGGLTLAAAPSTAQTEPRTVASIEIARPSITDEDMDWSIASAVVHLSVEHQTAGGVGLILDLPFARAAIEPEGGASLVEKSSSFAIGNPFVGLRVPLMENLSARVGGTIPLAKSYGDDDFAVGYGMFSDFEHFWSFMPDMFSLSGELDGRWESPRGWFATLGLGSSLAVQTDGDILGDRSELFAHYGGGVGYRFAQTEIAADVSGIAVVTEDELTDSGRSLHFVRVAGSHGFGRVRPEVYVRVPLTDEMRELVRYSLGVRFGVQLR